MNQNYQSSYPQHRTRPTHLPTPPQLILPPGWISVVDPASCRTYYANPTTSQTSWEPPMFSPPPPPTPAASQLGPAGTATCPNFAYGSSTQVPTQQQYPVPGFGVSNPGNIAAVENENERINNQMISYASTLQTAGLFIPAVRAIVQRKCLTDTGTLIKNEKKTNDKDPDIEFNEISAGIIADMAQVQANYRREQSSMSINHETEVEETEYCYYEPLKPMELPIVSKAPHIESGRVDIRLMSLMDAIGKI